MNFQQIIKNQYELNDLLAKETWINDPKVDMYQAAVDEAVTELLPSAGWAPWWKKSDNSVDLQNCHLEIVDILHFHIGAAIKETMFETVESYVDYAGDRANDPMVIKFVSEYPTPESFQQAWDAGDNFVYYTNLERELVIEEVAKEFIDAFSGTFARHPHIRAVQNYVGALLNYGARDSLLNLADLAASFDLSVEKMMTLYTAKNALNAFRTHNNYKGTDKTKPLYTKMWNGREDNEVLMTWVNQQVEELGNVPSREDIMAFLKEQYAQVSNG